MKKIYIYLLSGLLFLPLGCGTIKKVVGWGDEEESKKNNSPKITKKIIPPSQEKVRITTTTLSKWALYATITLVILFAIRYGVKKVTNKKK